MVLLCPKKDETTVIGALLLTRRDAQECLKSCRLIFLTLALDAISSFLRCACLYAK